ncbi:DUF502 domain-containing protein [Solitalea koreensis]|uniref:Uncharacterized membrane protein n=1 Tax=Solitalea koreensis TaxID=543615 RepID=A0A521BQI6_9SPHI|nr:DUF502 domain-containing protein [Solitalea koreensis]SMO49434.1 Uncharacterized membrane protein [Solitalea koreensis]
MNKLRRKAHYRIALTTLFGFFIKGLLFVLPIGLSLYIIFKAISWVDSIINVSIPWRSIGGMQQYIHLPGFGLLVVLTSVTLIGMFVTYVISDSLYIYFEGLLNKIPVFKLIYSSIKDFMESFFGDKKKFNEPVIVQFNDYGLKKIGFVTDKDLSKFNLNGEVGVYFPNSYGIMGEFHIIPADKVQPLNLPSADVMKYVVSGGVSEL